MSDWSDKFRIAQNAELSRNTNKQSLKGSEDGGRKGNGAMLLYVCV